MDLAVDLTAVEEAEIVVDTDRMIDVVGKDKTDKRVENLVAY